MKHVVSHVPDKVDASAVVNPVLTNKVVVVAQQVQELPIQTQIIIWGLFIICGFYLIMEVIHLYEEIVNSINQFKKKDNIIESIKEDNQIDEKIDEKIIHLGGYKLEPKEETLNVLDAVPVLNNPNRMEKTSKLNIHNRVINL